VDVCRLQFSTSATLCLSSNDCLFQPVLHSHGQGQSRAGHRKSLYVHFHFTFFNKIIANKNVSLRPNVFLIMFVNKTVNQMTVVRSRIHQLGRPAPLGGWSRGDGVSVNFVERSRRESRASKDFSSIPFTICNDFMFSGAGPR
jgi:hypothetical protein